MLNVNELAKRVDPRKTSLLLGAGASIESGGPSGADLAAELSSRFGYESGLTLSEVSTLVTIDKDRRELVTAIREILGAVHPTGGVRLIPDFDWRGIYSTNFDRIVEDAYHNSGRQLAIVRSNYEFRDFDPDSALLYKIHGCMTLDSVDGMQGRMVLTDDDIAAYAEFREALFRKLFADLIAFDTLIIGNSLKDEHLGRELREATEIQVNKGGRGRIFALIHEADDARARLWNNKGIFVCFSSMEQFFETLAKVAPEPEVETNFERSDLPMPRSLKKSVLSFGELESKPPNPVRLYNGGAASFADIRKGLTFKRQCEDEITTKFLMGDKGFLTIIGAGGVGKTTLARRVITEASRRGFHCWEHRPDLRIDVEKWAQMDSRLASSDQYAVLFVNDIAPHLRNVNELAMTLTGREDRRLKLVLTSSTAHWNTRIKDPGLFSNGHVEKISTLTPRDISEMVYLVAHQPQIKKLVDPTFVALEHDNQIELLKGRARADMYVCLKSIFGGTEIDTILLQEFAALDNSYRDVYKTVAALEAACRFVDRQLVVEMLELSTDAISDILNGLEDVVDEECFSEDEGAYVWHTRHEEIARVIGRVKYSDPNARYELFEQLINTLNAAKQLDLLAIRELCVSQDGITSIADRRAQIRLFERVISVAPGERQPYHKIIRCHIADDDFSAAAKAIADAENSVGTDPPLNRLKVQLQTKKAERTPGILHDDRVAMLRSAASIALDGIQRYSFDKYAYITYAQVGWNIAQMSGDASVLRDAVDRLVVAAEKTLDPMLQGEINDYQAKLARCRPIEAPAGIKEP